MVFRFFGRWWGKGDWQDVVEPHLLSFLATTPATQKRSLLPWIICLVGTILLLALSGPVWQKNLQRYCKISGQSSGFGFILFHAGNRHKTNKVDRARFKLEDLLGHFVEGETALIVNAGDAFVISPLTHDPVTIESLLTGLHPNIMPIPGSRSDLAIELAADLLSRRNGGTGHIILVTDGIEIQDFPAAEMQLV